jgi:hypothetical protein
MKVLGEIRRAVQTVLGGPQAKLLSLPVFADLQQEVLYKGKIWNNAEE